MLILITTMSTAIVRVHAVEHMISRSARSSSWVKLEVIKQVG